MSFAVREGETFGLVGESGCGKTTIGRLVVSPSSGPTRVDQFRGRGRLTTLRGSALRRRRRDLQLMFQDPYASLDPRMRVGDDPARAADVQGIGTPAEQRTRVVEMLGEVGLSPRNRSTSTPTSSPAASASGSGWRAPSRSTPS